MLLCLVPRNKQRKMVTTAKQRRNLRWVLVPPTGWDYHVLCFIHWWQIFKRIKLQCPTVFARRPNLLQMQIRVSWSILGDEEASVLHAETLLMVSLLCVQLYLLLRRRRRKVFWSSRPPPKVRTSSPRWGSDGASWKGTWTLRSRVRTRRWPPLFYHCF